MALPQVAARNMLVSICGEESSEVVCKSAGFPIKMPGDCSDDILRPLAPVLDASRALLLQEFGVDGDGDGDRANDDNDDNNDIDDNDDNDDNDGDGDGDNKDTHSSKGVLGAVVTLPPLNHWQR